MASVHQPLPRSSTHSLLVAQGLRENKVKLLTGSGLQAEILFPATLVFLLRGTNPRRSLKFLWRGSGAQTAAKSGASTRAGAAGRRRLPIASAALSAAKPLGWQPGLGRCLSQALAAYGITPTASTGSVGRTRMFWPLRGIRELALTGATAAFCSFALARTCALKRQI